MACILLRVLVLVALAALCGCAATLAGGISSKEQLAQEISVAPLATCIGIVQQTNMLMQSLKSGQPPVLPSR